MSHERFTNNGTVIVEGVTPLPKNGNIFKEELPPGEPSSLIKVVRAMYEGEHQPNEGTDGYYWRRGLQNTLTPSFFRRFDVLRDLNLHYGGDIPLAIRETFPTPQGKPPLSLDDPRPTDPLYQQWQQREEEIETRIEATRGTKKNLYFEYFKERKMGKRGGRMINVNTRIKHHHRMNVDNWLHRENQALNKALGTFVRRGDRVASLLSGHDPVIPSLLLGQVGQEGELYVVTPGPYLEQGLFAQFLDLFADFQRAKGEGREMKTPSQKAGESFDRRVTGSGLIRHWVREQINDFVTYPYQHNQRFYEEGLHWQNSLLMEKFFERFHIHPLEMNGTGIPQGIPSRSLDAVVEADRFSQLPENEKEAALYEIDRVLRPGGHLIIREGSREQAAMEYYGLELFDQHYRRLHPQGIKSGQLVVMRKNLEPGQIDRYTVSTTPSAPRPESSPTVTRPNSRQARRIRQAVSELIREVQVALHSEDASNAVSLSWFRAKGHLPLLISEYGGSIEKVIQAAKELEPVATNEKAHVIQIPEGAKSNYTIDDLSQELGASKNQIRKGIARIGVTTPGTTSSAGRSGFTTKAVASRQLNFSYEEYVILKDALKGLNLRPNPNNNTPVSKPRR